MTDAQTGQWLGPEISPVIARLEHWDRCRDRNGNEFWACNFRSPDNTYATRTWPRDAGVSVPDDLVVGQWYALVPGANGLRTNSLNRLSVLCPIAEVVHMFEWPAGFESEFGYHWWAFSGWLREIPCPMLQAFVVQVFLDRNTRERFFTWQASRSHHHSYPGGLAEHSVEVARRVAGDPLGFEPLERWVGSVAGLLHDIGKIRTMRSDGSRPPGDLPIDHEVLTLSVLSAPLEWLDRAAPEAAKMMRYVLSWSSEKERRPLLPVAMAVRESDRVSAALNARKLAFGKVPSWRQLAVLDGPGPRSWFWRSAGHSRKRLLSA